MVDYSERIPKSSLPPFNEDLSPVSAETMIRTLGNPVGRLTTDCQDVRAASTVVQALIETRNFGNFNATGIKPALDSLSRILDKAKEKDPDLFNVIGTAG